MNTKFAITFFAMGLIALMLVSGALAQQTTPSIISPQPSLETFGMLRLFLETKPVIVVGQSAPASDVVAAVELSSFLKELGIYGENEIGVAKLDTEMSSVSSTAIIIGSPCNNMIASQHFGNPTQCDSPLPEGKGLLIMAAQPNGKDMLLITARNPEQIRKLIRILRNWESGDLAPNVYSAPFQRVFDTGSIQVVPSTNTGTPQPLGSQFFVQNLELGYQWHGEMTDANRELVTRISMQIVGESQGQNLKVSVDGKEYPYATDSTFGPGQFTFGCNQRGCHMSVWGSWYKGQRANVLEITNTQTGAAQKVDLSGLGWLEGERTIPTTPPTPAPISPTKPQVIERDIEHYQYVRTFEDDIPVLDRNEQSITTEVHYQGPGQTPIAALVTTYRSEAGITQDVKKLVEKLMDEEQKPGVGKNKLTFAPQGLYLIERHNEVWAIWASHSTVLIVGNDGTNEVPDEVIDAYLAIYPSTLLGTVPTPYPAPPVPTQPVPQPTPQPPQSCVGCEKENRCLQFGVRLVDEQNTPVYCDLDSAFRPQKQNNEQCQNNHECLSNSCGNGKCRDIEERIQGIEQELKTQKGILQQILAFFTRLFGG